MKIHLVILATLIWNFCSRAQTFSLDHGVVTSIGGTANGDLLALNHFRTTTPVLIDQISVLWHPISATVSPTLTLYADPNGDGLPYDLVPLLIWQFSIPRGVVILNNTTAQTYDVTPTLVTGSFFVGAFLSDAESSFDPGIGIDSSRATAGQSWILENTSLGHMNLNSPQSSATMIAPLDNFVLANHIIRAHYVVPEPSAAALLALASGLAFGRFRKHRKRVKIPCLTNTY